MKPNKDLKEAKPSLKKFSSIAELMKANDVSDEVQKKVTQHRVKTFMMDELIRIRISAGLTQSQMAEKMGVTQSCISKIESKADSDLTLGEVFGYVKATNERIGIYFGKPMTHLELIQYHVTELNSHLTKLSDLAKAGVEFENTILQFVAKTYEKLMNIMIQCRKVLPVEKEEKPTFEAMDFSAQKDEDCEEMLVTH
jgi:transcriptional regulator with XRE-family HTH domain